ncbi:MAG TPA: FKBP-type peptidyl-prolyl cis-trans isomerase [Pedobacter sp.]|uniref:FKBP-type peptidyl-prolyl cis-trans isomerase n=1 Tax=Pedobacter sp. TaxID=1411316 RepID=UPI002C789BA6|nr:FKBP-type peptidyl-prolyl cis-trans isomerase [Pedobacter sp.]HMI03010.1 FKBP-type peptidyl-prolyl cis-trans isomerase [Pedobacter sp.]
MLKNRLLPGLIFMIGVIAACEKPEVYDPAERFAIEEDSIKLWANANGIELTKHESGLLYHIDTLGTGADAIELTDTLEVEYVCKLLRDTVVGRVDGGSLYKFALEKGIPGWQSGLPLIREGGQIRLLVPSPLAYRDVVVGTIPANSPLDFMVRIRNVIKKKRIF